MTRRFFVGVTAALAFLVFASAAAAATTTLGVTGPPAGAASGSCSPGPDIVAQETDDPSTPFIVPAGGGEITQWQTYTAGDTAGAGVTLAVLAPTASSGYYEVVATDAETLPNPLPANNVASFTPAAPIQVQAGDTLALYTSQSCYFHGGATPGRDTVVPEQQSGTSTVAPQAGQTLEPAGSPGPSVLNLAATLVTGEDAAVTSSAFPSSVQTGGLAVLSAVVTNDGPQTGTISFVDQVPSGLKVQSAGAGPGACIVSGQTVACTIAGLAVGQSSVVDVIVAASSAGSFTNQVSVAATSPLTDPNGANDAASATLTVTAPAPAAPTTASPTPTPTPPSTGAPSSPPRRCVVPGLRRVPLAPARTVLRDLGCRVRVLRRHSGLARYLVIGVRGRKGSYAYRHMVTLVVSTGPKPKKHTRR